MEFRVIWQIEIEAEGPMEAAWEARVIQPTPGMSATVFNVWAHGGENALDRSDRPARQSVRVNAEKACGFSKNRSSPERFLARRR